MTNEHRRLVDARDPRSPWKRWGPYLSERQWGTVREDYSDDGDAWNYFPHDHARSRAYKWGEDGIAGFCDDQQRLCWALALCNGRDPILKERLFGLTNGEGNHGEDVKECYFYDDSTPTHSWTRYVYKYPQQAFPYDQIVATNRSRRRDEPEYELQDTGAFDDQRYFDVSVEFAKATPEDVCIRITAVNRGPEPATLHVVPHLWFRNEWWMDPNLPRPALRDASVGEMRAIAAEHRDFGTMHLHCDGAAELLFTENETNTQRLWNQPNQHPYVKDGINDRIVAGAADSVNPAKVGTKAASHAVLQVPAGATAVVRMRLVPTAPGAAYQPFADFGQHHLRGRRPEEDAQGRGAHPGVPGSSPRSESTFLADRDGHRPVNGGDPLLDQDPAWRHHVLFYEYFHGDTGRGLGASHQSGWTGLVAFIVDFFERVKPEAMLRPGSMRGVKVSAVSGSR